MTRRRPQLYGREFSELRPETDYWAHATWRGLVERVEAQRVDNNVERKHCSFCGCQGRRGMRFAGGLGAMICEQCVEHYHSIYASPAKARKASAPPWGSMTDAEILGALPLIAQTADQVDEFLLEWVELARSRKLSWASIGTALGMSRQSAWERFAPRVGNQQSGAGSSA